MMLQSNINKRGQQTKRENTENFHKSMPCFLPVAMLVPLLFCMPGMSGTAVAAAGNGDTGGGDAPFTVCVVEECVSWTNNNTTTLTQGGSMCLTDVTTLLESRLKDLDVEVSLVHHLVSRESFDWTSQMACEVFNSSCSGVVVVISSCAQTQNIHHWASEHVIPYVIIPQNMCQMTSLGRVESVTQLRGGRHFVQELLTNLGWTQVAMLVDGTSAETSSTAELVKELSDVYMGSLLFRLSEHSPDHSSQDTNFMGGDFPSVYDNQSARAKYVRSHLHTVKESLFKNILVMASHEMSALILREAAKLDLLSDNHFWVLALPFRHYSDLVKEVKVREANILIVQPLPVGVTPRASCRHLSWSCKKSSSFQMNSSAVAEGVEALVRSAEEAGALRHAHYNGENSSICENSTDVYQRRSAIVKTLEENQQKTRSQIPTDTTTTMYSICSTAAHRTEGLVCVGHWSKGKGLVTTKNNLFRNTFRDFGYKTLRIGTQEAKPFVQKNAISHKFEGFCVDILKELAHKLKFDYVFVEPPDGEWGAPKDGNSSNWSGIVGMVLSGDVDFGIGPFTITSIRESVIDFTKPFMEDGVGILTKRPNSDAKKMFKMFTPLTPHVWGAVAGAVVLVSLCLYAIERTSPFSASNVHGDRTLGMLGCAWLIYGSYMEQGGDPHPRSVSARFLVGFWWLFTILMTSTYTANLAAFLTVTIEESPINSLGELAQSSNIKPLVKSGSNVKTLFQESTEGIYKEVWKKMAGMPVVRNNTEALKYVLQDTYAYMTDNSQLEYIMLKDCTTFSVAKELFNTGGFGFILGEDSPYMNEFNYNIMKMQEAGLMDKWRRRWWSSPDPCTSSDRTSAAKELDWPSLSGLFYIFIGVASLSILLRICEIWIHGDKLLRLWNRLKSMIFMAPSAERNDAAPSVYFEKPESVLCGGGLDVSDIKHGYLNGSSVRPVNPTNMAMSTFESPGRLEQRRVSTVDINMLFQGRLIGTRSLCFRDIDSEHQYWEPSLQRRSSSRLSARGKGSESGK